MPKHAALFQVEGVKWDATGYDDGVYCLSVEIGQDMLCVWAYDNRNDYLCIRYKANHFTGADEEQWLGPLETLCLIEEALKEAASIRANTKSST